MPPDPEPGSAWHEAASLRGQCAGPHGPDAVLRPTFDKSPVRESRTPGSVGEALSNQRLYPTSRGLFRALAPGRPVPGGRPGMVDESLRANCRKMGFRRTFRT